MAKIFISYSHRDQKWREELDNHLSLLKRQKIVTTWHDRRIIPGDEFKGVIDKNINDSDIILLLISPYFIASEYCFDVEMKRSIERHQNKEARVIPIILEHCDWTSAPFGKLLALPTDGKPISSFLNPHEAFSSISIELRKILVENFTSDLNNSINQSNNFVENSIEVEPVRSSNLTIRKDFTEKEIDDFIEDCYKYIQKFFKNSLEELKRRNDFIDFKINIIDSRQFSVKLFKYQKKVNECMIWYSDNEHFGNGINYSNSISRLQTGINESLRPTNNGNYLYLQAFNFFHQLPDKKNTHSKESAAEYYWSQLISVLQN